MREPCPGYRDEWELIFRDQTDHTIIRTKKKVETALAKRLCPKPTDGHLSTSPDEAGVKYFLDTFVFPGRGYLNYIPAIFKDDGECPGLMASMAAVGLVALASSDRRPALMNRAHAKYSEAIHHLNNALASPTESVKDHTLMSVISLGVFEHASNFEFWAHHVQGAAALVVARGTQQFTSAAAVHMFNQVRADMVTVCFHTNVPFPENLLVLQEEANNHPASSNSSYLLGVLATRCLNLFWVVRNKDEEDWSRLLHEANSIEHSFQQVNRVLTAQEPYRSISGSMGDRSVAYNGRFDVYNSNWGMRVWNSSRKLQLKLYEAIYFLLDKALLTNLPPPIREHLKQRRQETLERLVELGDDMLATVPQALGFVSAASSTSPSIDLSLPMSVSGAYMLTWGLYTVGKSSVIQGRTRLWIIRCLDQIGKIAGIRIALQLLEGICEIDELAGPSSLIEGRIPYVR